jgi:hypothetical protein
LLHSSISGVLSANKIQTHSNYSKVYVQNSGQYGLENKDNSFTFGIDHNNRNLDVNSIHNSKQYILDLIAQAWQSDKFEIEKGKFSPGYPQSASYNLCDQKLSVIFKFSKDQYSRKEDNRDIYLPGSVISTDIKSYPCTETCINPIIDNLFVDEISANEITIALNVKNNEDCCCNVQYSLDGNTWQQLDINNIDCSSVLNCLPPKIISGDINKILDDDSIIVQINPAHNADCCCSFIYSLDNTNDWSDVPEELVECEGSYYVPPPPLPPPPPPLVCTECVDVFGGVRGGATVGDIDFETVIAIPPQFSLPVVVSINGSVDDVLLKDGVPWPPGTDSNSAGYAYSYNWIENNRTFTLAAKDTRGVNIGHYTSNCYMCEVDSDCPECPTTEPCIQTYFTNPSNGTETSLCKAAFDELNLPIPTSCSTPDYIRIFPPHLTFLDCTRHAPCCDWFECGIAPRPRQCCNNVCIDQSENCVSSESIKTHTPSQPPLTIRDIIP